MRSLRIVAVLLLVTATYAVLETRSFTALQRVRLKLVQNPTTPAGGTARVAFSSSPSFEGAHPPFALIARLHNADRAPLTVTIGLDDREVCRSVVPGNATSRVDCVVEQWSSSENHSVGITGNRPVWQVEGLELATHFGNTSGFNYLVILPRTASDYRTPPPWFVVSVVASLLAIVLLLPPARWSRTWHLAHRAVSVLIVVVALALVVAPWMSQYRVVVSVSTVVFWLSLLCLPQLWTAGTWLTRARPMPSRLAIVRAVGVGCLATIPFVVVVRDLLLNTYDHNYSGFVKISKQAFDVNPVVRGDAGLRPQLKLLDSAGYDGQFCYFVAFDPLMRRFHEAPAQYRDVVDAVPYRFGRVGFSLLTRVMSFADPARFPQVMVWLTLVGIFGLACVLAAFAQRLGRSPAYGALVMLVPGFWQSVQNALPESLAAVTLVAGAVLLIRQRLVPAAMLFASSLLIRETGLLLVVFCAAALFARGDRRSALACLAVAIAPAVLWRLYVAWTMYPALGQRALTDYPGDLDVPLRGIVEMWRSVSAGEYGGGSGVLARAGISFSVLAGAGLAFASVLAAVRPGPFTMAAVAYGLIAVALDYEMIWVHVGNAQRGTYELFVLLALSAVTVGALPTWLRWTQRIFWAASAAYVFFGAAEAEALRAALLPN